MKTIKEISDIELLKLYDSKTNIEQVRIELKRRGRLFKHDNGLWCLNRTIELMP